MFCHQCIKGNLKLRLISLYGNKGIESLPKTLILESLYLRNQMLSTLDISNYEFCWIKYSENIKGLQVYNIRFQRFEYLSLWQRLNSFIN